MRAIGYVRVSTAGQAQDGVSLELQQAKLRAWAELHDVEMVEIHADDGVSGKRADREGLQKALEAVKRYRGVLVVYSLSRLSRSTLDTLHLAGELEKAGCDLVSLQEQIDTSSAAGRVIFRVLAALSEFEREQLAERTKAAMQHMKAQGLRVGSVPHGFRAEGPMLVEDEGEQKILRLVDELRRQGYSLRDISAELANLGVFNRHGRSYNAKSIRAMLLAA